MNGIQTFRWPIPVKIVKRLFSYRLWNKSISQFFSWKFHLTCEWVVITQCLRGKWLSLKTTYNWGWLIFYQMLSISISITDFKLTLLILIAEMFSDKILIRGQLLSHIFSKKLRYFLSDLRSTPIRSLHFISVIWGVLGVVEDKSRMIQWSSFEQLEQYRGPKDYRV